MLTIESGDIRPSQSLRASVLLRRLIPVALLALCHVGPAGAQNVSVGPASVVSEGRTFPSALFRPHETVRLSWSPAAPGMTLRIGGFAGEYGLAAVPVPDQTSLDFTPAALGLPVGVYHAVLTTAQAETTAGIRAAAAADPSVLWSPDFTLIVESPVAPTILGPRGTVHSATPVFRWEGIPGVPAYVVVLSSTPFELRTNPATNEPVVEGLTPVWGALTSETSAKYGQPSPDSPFPALPAPPLVPGREYYFSIVNAYSKSDVSRVSEAFGGVVAFTYEAFTGLLAPVLTAPEDGARFFEAPQIGFEWEPVEGAASYTFTLHERQTIGGSVGDVPVFSITTPSTRIDLDARRLMRRGRYSWGVIPSEATGAAGLSSERQFRYDVPMGAYRYRPKSSVDGTAILGARVSVENLDGRHAPLVPLVNTTESYSDSLVAGRYLFHASREQFADTSWAVFVQSNRLVEFNLEMRPLPARLSGQVADQGGQPLENARVALRRNGAEPRVVLTDSEGRFTLGLNPGTWSISVSSEGYSTAVRGSVVVPPGGQVDLGEPFILEAVAGFVTGRVVNESGRAVQLASVSARFGAAAQEAITDADGVFNFVLAEGVWTVQAAKEGFLGAAPAQLAVARGERISNLLVVLTERASQVSGTVFGIESSVAAEIRRRTIGGAVVEAIPAAGPVLSTTTDDGGSFVLDLGTGAYRLVARAPGLLPSERIDLHLGYGETASGIDLDLLQASTLVSGRVVTPAGLPVAGAAVTTVDPRASRRATATDQDGRFDLAIRPGHRALVVSAAGFETRSIEVGIAAGEQQRGISLILAPAAATLRGRITRSGAPIPRSRVTATGSGGSVEVVADDNGRYAVGVAGGAWSVEGTAWGHSVGRTATMFVQPGQVLAGLDLELSPDAAILDGAILDSGAGVGGVRLSLPGGGVTYSRPNGLFASPIPPGIRGTLSARKAGFAQASALVEAVQPLASRSVVLDLQPISASFSGSVSDPSGVPVSGARISALQDADHRETTSSWDGSYSLAVEAGSQEVRAAGDGFNAIARSMTLAVGERRTGVDFQLSSAYATLIVSVVDESGGPLREVGVTARNGEVVRTGRTGGDGRVILERLAQGAWTVEAARDGYITGTGSRSLTKAGAVELSIAVRSSPGGLRGIVIEIGGLPVQGAVVRATGPDGRFRLAETDTDGVFHLGGLAEGAYALQISSSRHALLEAPSVPVSDLVVDLGEVPLQLRTGRLSGTVRSAQSGGTVARAEITVRGPSGGQSTASDSEGRFELGTLASGTYSVEVLAEGFRRHIQSVELDGTVDLPVELLAADGRISGSVRDPGGMPLPFPVRVTGSAGSITVSTTTAPDGAFELSGLDPGLSWMLQTQANRPGYVDAEAGIELKSSHVTDIRLTVRVETAAIRGSAGTPRASVRLVNLETGGVHRVEPSRSDGRFSFTMLAPGNWRVVPQKSGVSFDPPHHDVTLAQGQQAEVGFTATSSVGEIAVLVVNTLRQPLASVDVVLASQDQSVIRSSRTGGTGRVVFTDLPIGNWYIVRPSLAAHSSTPPATTIHLTGTVAEQTFSLTEASGRIGGGLTDESGAPVSGGRVNALHGETGIQYEAAVEAERFEVLRLPAGTYTVSVEVPGFRPETTTVLLAENEERAGVDFRLRLASVILRGRVVYRGAGLGGARIRAEGVRSRAATTDGTGEFVIPALPLEASAPDTTIYQVYVEPPRGAPVARTLRIPGDRLGQVVSLAPFVLASASLVVELDDGLHPVPAARVVVERPDGQLFEGLTDADGRFVSESVLSAGRYRLTPEIEGRLRPSGPVLLPEIPSDTATVRVRVPVPWLHDPPEAVGTTLDTRIEVHAPPGYDYSGMLARLRFSAGGSERVLAMASTASGFAGIIPPQHTTDPILYSVTVEDPSQSISWSSGTIEIIPSAPGKLALIRIQPVLEGSRLRVGDDYELSLVVRDGIGVSLDDRFGPVGGSVAWSLTGPGSSTVIPDPENPTRATLRIGDAGSFMLTARAGLAGTTLSEASSFEAGDLSPESLLLSAPEPTLSNTSTGTQLSYQARDAEGRSQLLGSSLQWSVSPAGAGQVNASGVFIPQDPSFIGEVAIGVTDPVSGRSAQTVLSLFRRVQSGEGATLHDLAGTQLVLAAGSFPFAADIGLSRVPLAGPKRDARPLGDPRRFTVGDRLYRFSMRADRALLNDSLLVPAELTLAADPSLALFGGERSIGRFDVSRLQWRLEESTDAGHQVSARAVSRLTEFGLLVPNQSLGLEHAAVLPNPFSPDVAPLRIGYLLTTDEPPATVSIRIFNLRGELVRTLLSDEPQQPGRYGSRTSRRELLWDGLTDAGSRARNGRYIVEIRAADASGETTERISVVLVR